MEVIRKQALAARLGVTPRTVADRVKSGALPSPFYIREIPYWSLDEIDAFFQRKMETRADDAQAKRAKAGKTKKASQ